MCVCARVCVCVCQSKWNRPTALNFSSRPRLKHSLTSSKPGPKSSWKPSCRHNWTCNDTQWHAMPKPNQGQLSCSPPTSDEHWYLLWFHLYDWWVNIQARIGLTQSKRSLELSLLAFNYKSGANDVTKLAGFQLVLSLIKLTLLDVE